MLLSLGGSGAGGLPLRLGRRDGKTSDSIETPVAIAEGLALGLQGVPGIVAESKAYSRRTLGLWRAKGLGLGTRVPRTGTGRQELEAWGAQPPALPLLVEKPGRTRDEACRQWQGQSVTRSVEVEHSDGRVTQEDRRFLVVHSSQLAQPHTQTYASAQAKAAEALTDHRQRGHARWLACEADAAAAIAEYEHHAPGRRGRRPHPWRYHAVRYRVVADTRRTRRARRGRPAKTAPPPLEAGERLVVDVEALAPPEEATGWMVLATPVPAEVGSDTDILHAYQDQNTTVEPGWRWSKNPAAITPVWLEKPERIAALALLTVRGLLVYSVLQRQVRLSLHTQGQQLPGNKGLTAIPTAAVVLALCAQVALVRLWIDAQEVVQLSGVHLHHRLVCEALGLASSWYTVPLPKNSGKGSRSLSRGVATPTRVQNRP